MQYFRYIGFPFLTYFLEFIWLLFKKQNGKKKISNQFIKRTKFPVQKFL